MVTFTVEGQWTILGGTGGFRNLHGQGTLQGIPFVGGNYSLQIWFAPPGDVDGDFDVDLLDLAAVAYAYETRPGDTRWNARADFDNNNRIGIVDLATVAYYYDGTKA